MVNKRERSVFKLRAELNEYLEWAREAERTGHIPQGLMEAYQRMRIKEEPQTDHPSMDS